MIATIDDGTAALELTLYSDVYEPNRAWLKEDELLIAKVNVSPDKFSGGLRVVADSVMDMVGARLSFARNVHLNLSSSIDLKALRAQMNPYLISAQQENNTNLKQGKSHLPPNYSNGNHANGNHANGNNPGLAPASSAKDKRGLPLTAAVMAKGGACLVQFPDDLRLYPDDACLRTLQQILSDKSNTPVEVQYAS